MVLGSTGLSLTSFNRPGSTRVTTIPIADSESTVIIFPFPTRLNARQLVTMVAMVTMVSAHRQLALRL
jgi:hypothetical protein